MGYYLGDTYIEDEQQQGNPLLTDPANAAAIAALTQRYGPIGRKTKKHMGEGTYADEWVGGRSLENSQYGLYSGGEGGNYVWDGKDWVDVPEASGSLFGDFITPIALFGALAAGGGALAGMGGAGAGTAGGLAEGFGAEGLLGDAASWGLGGETAGAAGGLGSGIGGGSLGSGISATGGATGLSGTMTGSLTGSAGALGSTTGAAGLTGTIPGLGTLTAEGMLIPAAGGASSLFGASQLPQGLSTAQSLLDRLTDDPMRAAQLATGAAGLLGAAGGAGGGGDDAYNPAPINQAVVNQYGALPADNGRINYQQFMNQSMPQGLLAQRLQRMRGIL